MLCLTVLLQVSGILPLKVTDAASKVTPTITDIEELLSSPVTTIDVEQQQSSLVKQRKYGKYKIQTSAAMVPYCIFWRMILCLFISLWYRVIEAMTDGNSISFYLAFLQTLIMAVGIMLLILDTHSYLKLFNDLHRCNESLKKPMTLGYLFTGFTICDIIWIIIGPIQLVMINTVLFITCDDENPLNGVSCMVIPTIFQYWALNFLALEIFVISMGVLQNILLDLQANIKMININSIQHIRYQIKKVCNCFKL